MGNSSAALAATARRVFALALLLGAMTAVALLLGAGSAEAHESTPGALLHAVRGDHDQHAKAPRARVAHTMHAARTAVRHTRGSGPVRHHASSVVTSVVHQASPVKSTVRGTVTRAAAIPVRHARTVLHQATSTLPGGLVNTPVTHDPAAGSADHRASPARASANGSPSGRGDALMTTASAGFAAGATASGDLATSTASSEDAARIGSGLWAERDRPANGAPLAPPAGTVEAPTSVTPLLLAGLLAMTLMAGALAFFVVFRRRRLRLAPGTALLPGSSPD